MYAQTDDISEKVAALENKIKTTEKGEKLKWKDSLLTVIEYNETYEYGNKLEETLKYAIAIDSIKTAIKISSYIVFDKMHRLQKPEESINAFEQFKNSGFDKSIGNPKYLGRIHSKGELIKKSINGSI